MKTKHGKNTEITPPSCLGNDRRKCVHHWTAPHSELSDAQLTERNSIGRNPTQI